MGSPVGRVPIDMVKTDEGHLKNPLVPTVFVNGYPIGVVGTEISNHNGHNGKVMAAGSTTVFAGGLAVVRQGDPATCSHSLKTGSPDVFAG